MLSNTRLRKLSYFGIPYLSRDTLNLYVSDCLQNEIFWNCPFSKNWLWSLCYHWEWCSYCQQWLANIPSCAKNFQQYCSTVLLFDIGVRIEDSTLAVKDFHFSSFRQFCLWECGECYLNMLWSPLWSTLIVTFSWQVEYLYLNGAYDALVEIQVSISKKAPDCILTKTHWYLTMNA